MADELNPSLEDRRALPFAVGVRLAGQSHAQTDYTHFKTMGGAETWADLFKTEGFIVTRWVALTEPEWRADAVTPGWRRVTYFSLPCILSTSAVSTLADGVRTVSVETDGSVGAETAARNRARIAFGFGSEPYLSHRLSQYGTLTFYFTDRKV